MQDYYIEDIFPTLSLLLEENKDYDSFNEKVLYDLKIIFSL